MLGVRIAASLLPWIPTGQISYGSSAQNGWDERRIALTFDDGPNEAFLASVLPILSQHRIPAAFFVVGQRAHERPELLTVLASGNWGIANHGYFHERPKRWGRRAGVRYTLMNANFCADTIEMIIGSRPRHYRSPYWGMSREIYDAFCEVGYHVQLLDNWRLLAKERGFRDVNTGDYFFTRWYARRPGKALESLIRHVRRTIRLREQAGVFTHVLVFHEIPVTAEVLPRLIFEWMDSYKFISLEEACGFVGGRCGR